MKSGKESLSNILGGGIAAFSKDKLNKKTSGTTWILFTDYHFLAKSQTPNTLENIQNNKYLDTI